ncbi:helix-turn-helix domain-containing protein [Nocardia higoensis]|uniref:Helix-turn-helix domain-containing protein n=1 Tax=Nocardia higoensis TaxID=228599 RepID=A0ABS0DDR9_9NOCA|nr:helix-turn-helix domain-containing protein [Nocardia higoensis]MBF6355049.1 helix-turn-helix domain-containing protein [Nocardia higoensis]
MSDNELGLFLRSRRDAVAPASVGLPAGARRRAPGLRRSELALLAGVSVEYLTRLEQGRDRRPSPEILAALADALRLTPGERVHLYRLTKAADPGFACTGSAPMVRTVRPAVRSVLDHLDPAAAALFDRTGEVLACTDGYRRLMAPSGLFDEENGGRLAWYVFADARARELYPDWSEVADQWVATLKEGPFRADPVVGRMVEQLTVVAGVEFTRRVATVPGLPAASGITRMNHPVIGPLRLAYETLDLSADDAQRLIVHLPADEASAHALDRLAGRRPGGLRAVSG